MKGVQGSEEAYKEAEELFGQKLDSIYREIDGAGFTPTNNEFGACLEVMVWLRYHRCLRPPIVHTGHES